VLIVEIDRVDAESFQACVTRRAHIFRAPAHTAYLCVFRLDKTKLRGEHKSVSLPTNRATDQLFVHARGIDVRGI
jgi:hypothetical protein